MGQEKNIVDDLPLDYRIVDSFEDLQRVAEAFERQQSVAVDLEADSMYHFRERVCLIQMASRNLFVVIDPLKIGDLSPLRGVFENPRIQKIFHGADYDVRSLYRDFSFKINTMFDTQVASRFLGIRQTGLDAVLQERFGIRLDKKFQKKDWSLRPLPPEMIEYAAKDVLYLHPLSKILQAELKEKNRLSWVQEECEGLSRVRPAENPNAPLFLRFKGAGRLNRRHLAILEALLQFRRHIAETLDRPLFKVIGNHALMRIAVDKPISLKELEDSRALSSGQFRNYGRGIVEAVNHALLVSDAELPVYPRVKTTPVPPEVAPRVKALKSRIENLAASLELEAPVLCPKALIGTIATVNPVNIGSLKALPDLKNWQLRTFGHEIVAVLKELKGKNKR